MGKFDRVKVWGAVQKARHWADFIRPSDHQRADAEQIDLVCDAAMLALLQMDGSTRSAVKAVTGASDEELDQLGSFSNDSLRYMTLERNRYRDQYDEEVRKNAALEHEVWTLRAKKRLC